MTRVAPSDGCQQYLFYVCIVIATTKDMLRIYSTFDVEYHDVEL